MRQCQSAIAHTSPQCRISPSFLLPLGFPSRHLQGSDGSPEDPFTASALAADPAGAGAGAALLRPGSYVSPIPAAACGP